MSREILAGEVASMRSFMERSLYVAVSTGALPKQRLELERFVDKVKLIPMGKRTNTECEILRSISLLKSIECGAFQPSVYNPSRVRTEEQEGRKGDDDGDGFNETN